jgi:hypothetical protein
LGTQRLRFDLAAAFGDVAPERTERRLGSLDPLRQAQGFLMLAAGPQPPDAARLLAALATRDEDLTGPGRLFRRCPRRAEVLAQLGETLRTPGRLL